MNVELFVLYATIGHLVCVVVYLWWQIRNHRKTIQGLYWIQANASRVVSSALEPNWGDSGSETVTVSRRQLQWLKDDLDRFWEENK